MKIPKAVKLPSGSWRVSLMVNGQRISITQPTKKAAESEAAAIKSGAKRAAARTDFTTREIIEQYIASKDAVLSPSTVSGYHRIVDKALPEWLLDMECASVTQREVQKAVNEMAKSRSPKSVRNAHGLLSAALTAYDPTLILRTTFPQKQRYDASVPSTEDVAKIMREASGSKDELPIFLAVWLGLRMSEIIGLKWEDVDGNVLHIRRALVDEGEKTTKSFSSQRDLILPQHIKRLIDSTQHTGEYIVNITRRTLYSRFQSLCRRAGVQHYRFHDLRHINASVMLALGVPNKYAQERMGHATDNMLKTVYQHTMSAEQQAVAEKVDRYFEQFTSPD